MSLNFRTNATRSVEKAIQFLASNWVLIALGTFVVFGIFLANEGWDFWSEHIFRDGKVVEVRTDRSRIIQQIGVVLLAVPALLFAVWRSWTAHQQAQASLKQVQLAERAQNIDRYQKGAQMLDSERLSVRLAGVYALRELAAIDAAGHLSVVLLLLSGFARDRSVEERVDVSGGSIDRPAAPVGPAPEDIRDAVVALGQILPAEPNELPTRLSLRGVTLIGAHLHNLQLTYVDFSGAFLDDGRWNAVNVSGADFTDAGLRIVAFRSDFSYCSFDRTDFGAARFRHCDLSHSVFENMKITEEFPFHLRFEDCNISGITFEGVSGLNLSVFRNCWAWSDAPPGLPEEILSTVQLFDPGPDGRTREAHDTRNKYLRPTHSVTQQGFRS